MSSSFPCVLPPDEHVRQLQRVFAPLNPGFVAEELECTPEAAAAHLYGERAARHTWVSLADVAQIGEVPIRPLKAWMRRHHVPCVPMGPGRTAVLLVHLDDARWYLERHAPRFEWRPFPNVEYLTRLALPEPEVPGPAPAPVVDVDWQLARRAAWPMTAERLAEAVFGTRSGDARPRALKLLRRWEREGRVVCFARGLYDLVRPVTILDPAGHQGRPLPLADSRRLRANHPELAHWPSAALGAAWRAYSALYGGRLLPVLDRAEPTLLEFLLVRQLHPGEQDLRLDARYEALCQDAALYRVGVAPVPRPAAPVPVTAENIEAGLIDFQALVQATRRKLQRGVDRAPPRKRRDVPVR
ncbi:hypothetical protein [Deinococcus ficus]|uniref:Uncharacterized protein n=1 Tax=Deinococcus ficus TaxID=317577 RepID=A0A221T368_9DEIO|nr:hypothetical protein [Deinococcus ficus]ASN83335.1 hypothetical protein DFI_19245 [Deinococcus ficus]